MLANNIDAVAKKKKRKETTKHKMLRLQVQVPLLRRKGSPESFADPLVLLQLYLLVHHWIHLLQLV